jgi:hypothetical protein
MRTMLARTVAFAAAVPLAVPFLAASAQTATASPAVTPSAPVVVVTGLNNPRQLSLLGNGTLLIAEAGKGGTEATVTSPEGGAEGIGHTGSISEVDNAATASGTSPHRIITGLLSAGAAGDPQNPPGSGATGSDGVSARSLQSIAVQETFFPAAAIPAADADFNGKLLRGSSNGTIDDVADITGYEVKHDPDKQGIDSDPYAVLVLANGSTLVADAAGNDILKVDRFHHVSLFHVFPNIVDTTCSDPSMQQPPPALPGCQFVPTSLATDKFGHIFVGALGGLVPGEGRVVELSPNGKEVVNTWTGFTSVTGVAVDRSGNLFVSQLFATQANPVNPMLQGVLTKVSGSTQTNVDVPFPAGVAVDRWGNVFVSTFSIATEAGFGVPGFDTSGQVWRLTF